MIRESGVPPLALLIPCRLKKAGAERTVILRRERLGAREVLHADEMR